MSNARRAVPAITFNGANVTKKLAPYLESLSYTDVAAGSSDSMEIKLQNIDMKWLGAWYPTKGDKIKGSIEFKDWKKDGDNWTYQFGKCILDEISFSGNPLSASFGALAVPANESFTTKERTKTWKDVTLAGIAGSIAGRYGLSLGYDASSIQIKSLEQSQESDSAFLFKLCEKYGLSMKVYNSKLAIYDMGKLEAKGPSLTLKPEDMIDGDWEFRDALAGTYTGARVSYKKTTGNEAETDEYSVFVGLVGEDAKGSRVLRLNETTDSKAEAKMIGAAKVNISNRETTTFSCTILANKKMYTGITVKISGLGKADGKYFVDKVTTTVEASGSTQKIEMHKCQPQL